MNCLIVDDDKLFRIVFKRLMDLDSTLILIGECEDATVAYQKIIDLKVDLIFLDINMPGMSGLELAGILEKKSPLIIFTTCLAEHALEAFDLNAVDYLLKPISPSRFLKGIQKAKETLHKNQINPHGQRAEFIFIRDSNIVHRLNFGDILYLESTGDYVKIRMANSYRVIHSSLKAIEEKLPQHIFVRVHRSFIVNLCKVDSTEGKTLLVNRHLIPVSDTYRANLNRYMRFL
ncbi:LytR/AlgR family response regulator transcription factor [Pedobacter mendelii]|uniref:DNA-binding response regulator n=1 Tax=Pedobacter mendelii TaxID=1908240 RepID=A0ABQ2BN79_9SPHI|nr:LytTR family DNA-binding domain-containing protein [Pedobacter mendelii]GGI28647.1 DNA-binding response regulator [Pedobacter mendelii]